MRKITIAIALVVVLVLVASGIFLLQQVLTPFDAGYPRVYIQSDGSVEPSTAPINCDGNLYTLQADIELYKLFIEKSNIIFDGSGFSIKIVSPRVSKVGPHIGSIELSNVNKVTLKNLDIGYRDSPYKDVPGAKLIFDNSAFCEALNNTVQSIDINKSHDILVSENYVSPMGPDGGIIRLTDSTNCTITSNTIQAVRLHNSPGNTIRDNT